MTRRETQDLAWNSWDDDTSADLDDRILALLTTNPQGLCDAAMSRALGVLPQTLSGNRRHLVEKGRVRWSGDTVVKPNGRSSNLWVLGEDTPEQRAGTRRWPPVYTELRLLVEDDALDTDRTKLDDRMATLIARATNMSVSDDEVRRDCLVLAAYLVRRAQEMDDARE